MSNESLYNMFVDANAFMSKPQIPEWLSVTPEGVIVHVLVQPKASRSEVVGPHGEPSRLKIRIAAPPVDGAANEELLRFLKKELKVPRSRLSLLRGETSRSKDVLCEGVVLHQIIERLA